MKGYDTAEYAATRLIDTIILYKGDPVRVMSCVQFGKQIAVTYVTVLSEEHGQAFLDDFDMNPPILGYVNVGNKTCQYITRMPMRKDWKQGVRKNNIVTNTGVSPDLNMKYLAKTIIGKFPSIAEVVKNLSYFAEKGYPSYMQAFDRDFAADAKGRVWYKGMFNIGEINLANGGIKVNPEHEWTREALMEVVGEVA